MTCYKYKKIYHGIWAQVSVFLSVTQRMMPPTIAYYWQFLNKRHTHNPSSMKLLYAQWYKHHFNIHRESFTSGAGEMIQQITYLSYNHEGPPETDKSWASMVVTCNFSTHEAETVFPWGKMARLAGISDLWVQLETLYPYIKWTATEANIQPNSWPPHLYTCTNVPPHICVPHPYEHMYTEALPHPYTLITSKELLYLHLGKTKLTYCFLGFL